MQLSLSLVDRHQVPFFESFVFEYCLVVLTACIADPQDQSQSQRGTANVTETLDGYLLSSPVFNSRRDASARYDQSPKMHVKNIQ